MFIQVHICDNVAFIIEDSDWNLSDATLNPPLFLSRREVHRGWTLTDERDQEEIYNHIHLHQKENHTALL